MDPDSDSYVFRLPGSGSGSSSHRYGSGSGSGSFYHQAKIVRKTLIPRYCFVTSFWLLHLYKWFKMYLQKVISRKTFFIISLLLASWRLMTKIEGSGSHQNVMDPQHWKRASYSNQEKEIFCCTCVIGYWTADSWPATAAGGERMIRTLWGLFKWI